MNKRSLTALATSLLLFSSVANADVISSLSFTTPTGTVGPNDTIEVWVTLTLGAGSETLTFDESVSPLINLPASLIPANAEVWNGGGYDLIPFASYSHVSQMYGRYCSGTFTSGCGPGEYTVISPSGGNTWFAVDSMTMAAGESQDFHLFNFTPTDGSAASGEYIFYNASMGFIVYGKDGDGNDIDQDIVLGSTCPGQQASCAFTRTVVPIPAAVWLFGSGLIGLVGIARKRRTL